MLRTERAVASHDSDGMKNHGLGATAVSTQETHVKSADVQRVRQSPRNLDEESANELATSIVAMHATLECTTDVIVVTDEENRVRQFNQKFTKLWGIPSHMTMAARAE